MKAVVSYAIWNVPVFVLAFVVVKGEWTWAVVLVANMVGFAEHANGHWVRALHRWQRRGRGVYGRDWS